MVWMSERLAGWAGVLLLSWNASLLLPTALSAQVQNSSAPKYRLEGSVINSVTGEPIRRALVQIYAGPERLAFTDSNGQFQFEGLEPGETRITARKPGFFDVPHPGYVMQSMVKIGPESQPVTLQLFPQSVIRGHVQNLDDEPIEGLPVKAIIVRIVDGRKQLEPAGTGATDEDGNFRIAGLRPGTYYVETGPETRSRFPDRGQHRGAYSTMFYPSAHELSSASSFELGPGETFDASFSLKEEPLFQIAGSIGCLGVNDAIGLELVDHSGEVLPVPMRTAPDPCHFRAEVPGGSFTLVANVWHEGVQYTAEVPLTVNSDIAGISLVPSPIRSIPITVMAESTHSQRSSRRAPVADLVRIHFHADNRPLARSDFYSERGGDPRNPSPVFRNLPSGRYSAEVDANSPWYVQSAQCGDTDLLRDELTVTAGSQTPPIEIVLRDDGGTLTGKVDLGQGIRPTAVVLLPEHGPARLAKTATANDSGNFTIQGLAPGNYEVLAFDLMDGLEYSNPEVLNRFLSRAAHVTVQANEERSITVEVTKGGS
jgi:Carboxypeptidase regulatory-like domain